MATINSKGLTVDPSELTWRKSRRSSGPFDNCVEVASFAGGMAVRDSKNPTGPVLLFTTAEWDAFVGGAKDGEFDR